MAIEIIGGAEVRLGKEERARLGEDFIQWIAQVEDDRRGLITEVYNKIQENLDARAPIKSFPWIGASNAFAPLTGTYADALQARLFKAATAHDPTNLVLPRGAGALFENEALGIKVDHEKWANWWQRISRWVERDEIDQKSLMEEVTMTMTYFGDAWVYLPWEEQSIAQIDVLKNGKLKVEPRWLYKKPMPKVIHPKDMFIRWDAGDHQLERLLGFQWDLDLPTLDELDNAGIYDSDVADEIRKKLQVKRDEDRKRPRDTGYFRQLGTRLYSPDEYEERQKEMMKLERESGNRSVKMLKMFARVDLDGDGIPEDTIFDVEKETGRVAFAKYANYLHRERPLIHYWFKKRPGASVNIGVGEMMINVQDIVNTSLRDWFDNNKVNNTSIFLVKKGSGIKKGHKFYPSATYWVNNPKEDFLAVNLGAGKSSASIEAIPLLERWGQFIVGLSDFQLGQEKRSRTPATTTTALIGEANIRPDRTIEVMRNAMRKQHKQILMLYFQNGDPAKLAQVAAVEEEDLQLFQDVLKLIPPEAMAEALVIDPDVSSNALNRDARRQEALALFAQLSGYYDRITLLMSQTAGALGDPFARALFLAQVKGLTRAMRRVLDTFEERDQREILPDNIVTLIEGVTSVPAEGGGGEAPNQPTPAEAAQGLVTNEGPAAGPVAPEGRPVAGQPRVPAATRANGGDNQ